MTRTIVALAVLCGLRLQNVSAAPDPKLPATSTSKRQLECGIASWHDPGARTSASRTASQRAWKGEELVAAHKTLALGTQVRVFNLSNGREVIVVITDRGPFRRGRIIDVSRSAAQKLGLIEAGTAHVRIEPLAPGTS